MGNTGSDVRPGHSIALDVRLLSGEPLATIAAKPSWTLAKTRSVVQQHVGDRALVQRLVPPLGVAADADGRDGSDSLTVKELGLESGSVLQAVLGIISWGAHVSDFEATDGGRLLVKRSGDKQVWRGAMSAMPVPRSFPVTLRLRSATGDFYSYFGLVPKEAEPWLDDLRRFRSNLAEYLYYFNASTPPWVPGIHDSILAKKNRCSDWIPSAVPAIPSGGCITIEYTFSGSIKFSVEGTTVYEQHGFSQDLFLYASLKRVNESVEILPADSVK